MAAIVIDTISSSARFLLSIDDYGEEGGQPEPIQLDPPFSPTLAFAASPPRPPLLPIDPPLAPLASVPRAELWLAPLRFWVNAIADCPIDATIAATDRIADKAITAINFVFIILIVCRWIYKDLWIIADKWRIRGLFIKNYHNAGKSTHGHASNREKEIVRSCPLCECWRWRAYQAARLHYRERFQGYIKRQCSWAFFTVQKAMPLMKDGGSIILNSSAWVKGFPALPFTVQAKQPFVLSPRTWTSGLKGKIRGQCDSPRHNRHGDIWWRSSRN